MFPVPTVLLLIVSLYGAHAAPCVGTGISCDFGSTYVICSTSTENGVTAGSLINQCTAYTLDNPAVVDYRFSIPDLNQQTLTLDIAPGVDTLRLFISGTNGIVFNNTHPDISRLVIYSYSSLSASQDFLRSFPNLQRVELLSLKMDGFPTFQQGNTITRLELLNLLLVPVVTIQSSQLDLPLLTDLTIEQEASEEWYRFADDAFDNILNLESLRLFGVGHINRFQFAKLELLKYVSLVIIFSGAIFEEGAFSGLDEMADLTIRSSEKIDFILSYTFPKLSSLEVVSDQLTSLDQEFFQRQKALNEINAVDNPFECGCEMAWVSHVANIRSWTVLGTCTNGDDISDSSNYASCPPTSYVCFNSTFVCPSDSRCVNTADSAYCECSDGVEVEQGDTCSDGDRLTHQSTLSVLLLLLLLMLLF